MLIKLGTCRGPHVLKMYNTAFVDSRLTGYLDPMVTMCEARVSRDRHGASVHDEPSGCGSSCYTHSCTGEVIGEATSRSATNGKVSLYEMETVGVSRKKPLSTASSASNANIKNINAAPGEDHCASVGCLHTEDASRGSCPCTLFELPH